MSRFFCHTCNSRIERINSDFTCPTCSTGFIEEVDDDHHSDLPGGAAGGGGGGGGLHQFNPSDFLQLIGLDASHGFPVNSFRFGSPHQSNPASPTTTSASATSATTTTTPGSQTQSTQGSGGGHQRSHHRPHFSFVIDGRPVGGGGIGLNFGGGGGGASGGSASGGSAGSGGGGGGGSENPMENMFLSFISDLITGLGGGGQNVGGGGGGFPFAAGNINLGDYAWGQGGLDAIVTQLMNNLEGTGPPPLSADRLSELNRIEITKEQVEGKLQCSVCWEDFSQGENVIRLDCEHIYHDDCILPWLKLHGTCPVCRKDLNSLLGGDSSKGSENPLQSEASSGRSRSSSAPPPFSSSSASTTSSSSSAVPSNPISNNNSQTTRQQQQQHPPSSAASTGNQGGGRGRGGGANSSGALDEDMEFD